MNIRHCGAMEAADTTMMFRYAVKQIAASHGLVATFMAKPFSDLSGNGLHIHQSLWSDGGNAFATEAGTEISDAGRQYVAGLLDHIGALTLLGARTPNAYKRRVDLSFAPVNSTWERTTGRSRSACRTWPARERGWSSATPSRTPIRTW